MADLMECGQRFIVVRTLTPPQNSVAVVQNWLREFQKWSHRPAS